MRLTGSTSSITWGLPRFVLLWTARGMSPEAAEGLVSRKGWACGVAEKGGDWLGSYDWARHQRCVDGKSYPVVQQGVECLMGKVTTSAECMNCNMLLPIPGRSYEHSGKGAP